MLGQGISPTPWITQYDADGYGIYAETGAGKERLALVSDDIGDADDSEAGMTEANRDLIIAAPEMLDALKDAFNLVGSLLVEDTMTASPTTLDPDAHDALANWHTEAGKLLGIECQPGLPTVGRRDTVNGKAYRDRSLLGTLLPDGRIRAHYRKETESSLPITLCGKWLFRTYLTLSPSTLEASGDNIIYCLRCAPGRSKK